jgi:hypothetical protein
MESVQGDDPGIFSAAIADAVAFGVVGNSHPFIPVESLTASATTLMVIGRRVGGPIGVLLEVAGHSIEEAVAMYVAEYGPNTSGPAPDYYMDGP